MCTDWLKTTKSLSVFGENCIREIKLNRDFKFRFVNSSYNPADLATRGLSVSVLNQCLLWWYIWSIFPGE